MKRNTRFLIIDGNSIACRAAYVFVENDLQNSQGQPTGAIFRFIRMVSHIFDIVNPTHIVVAWDTNKNTFRKKLYADYKVNRKDDSHNKFNQSDIYWQFNQIRKILELLGIKNVNVESYEGDDICGTYAKLSKAEYTYILTGDRDSYQLINENTFIISPQNGNKDFKLITPQIVEEKFSVKPEQIISFKTLQGDTSDNIPGLNGCGPKTAAKLIQVYGSSDKFASLSINEMLADKKISKKLREDFPRWVNQYNLIKTLVTIYTDVPVPYTYGDCKVDTLNWNKCLDLFKQFEMNSFVKYIENKKLFTQENNNPYIPAKNTQERKERSKNVQLNLFDKL